MRSLVLLMMVAGIAGCGSDQVPMYPVSGKLRFSDGKKVRHGTIELTSVEHGTTATGKIEQDGSFVLGTYTPNDGAAAGEHKAIVIQMVISDGAFKHTIDHGRPVPTRYARYESSDLKVVVQAEPKNDIVVTVEE